MNNVPFHQEHEALQIAIENFEDFSKKKSHLKLVQNDDYDVIASAIKEYIAYYLWQKD